MILAILNLHVAPMPPTKFGLNLTGADVFSRRIAKQNDLNNSESLCHSDASHQVSNQSNTGFGRRCLKNFNMAGHLGYQNGTVLAILNLYVAPTPPIKFWLKRTYGLGGEVVQPSWISEWNYFSNSESL